MKNVNDFLTNEGIEKVSKFLSNSSLINISNIKCRTIADAVEIAPTTLLPGVSTPRSLSLLTSEKEIVKSLKEVDLVFEKLTKEMQEKIVIQVLNCHKNYLKLFTV